jgi:hypothetical protein
MHSLSDASNHRPARAMDENTLASSGMNRPVGLGTAKVRIEFGCGTDSARFPHAPLGQFLGARR